MVTIDWIEVGTICLMIACVIMIFVKPKNF